MHKYLALLQNWASWLPLRRPQRQSAARCTCGLPHWNIKVAFYLEMGMLASPIPL